MRKVAVESIVTIVGTMLIALVLASAWGPGMFEMLPIIFGAGALVWTVLIVGFNVRNRGRSAKVKIWSGILAGGLAVVVNALFQAAVLSQLLRWGDWTLLVLFMSFIWASVFVLISVPVLLLTHLSIVKSPREPAIVRQAVP